MAYKGINIDDKKKEIPLRMEICRTLGNLL